MYRICPTDLVRVVDPQQNRVLAESAAFTAAWGGGNGSCYGVWGRQGPCDLCVSRQALATGQGQAKLRLMHDRVLLMMAIPLQQDGRLVVAEHLYPLAIGGGSVPVAGGWEQDLSTVIALAYRDCLTGVYSRHLLELCLNQVDAEQLPMTAVLIDLDDFKAYNDAHGHAVGDLVLAAFGAFLQRLFSGHGAVFRFGGDEFIALLPHCPAAQVRAMLTVFANPCVLSVAGRQVAVAAAAGCCQIDHPGAALSEVISQADRMLYHSKEVKKQLPE